MKRHLERLAPIPDEPSAFYRIVAWAMIVWLVWAAILFSGCASSRATSEETIRSLEREVARLKAERANIDARSRALDDKLVIMNKKLGKCETLPKPDLQVVRLTPSEDIEPEDEPEAYTEDRTAIVTDKKRPTLKLHESAYRLPARTANAPRLVGSAPKSIPVRGDTAFSGLGAEDLGVVAMGAKTAESVSGMDQFNRAYLSFSNKSYDAALQQFASFIQMNSSHAYADDALYWRGECYLAKGKLMKAIGEFERLAKRYPNSEKVPAGLYRIGFVYDKLRDYKTAVRYYFRVVERFPGTDAARRASSRVTEIENRTQGGGILPTSAKR